MLCERRALPYPTFPVAELPLALRIAIIWLVVTLIPTVGRAIEIDGVSAARALCAHALPVSEAFADEESSVPPVSPVPVDCADADEEAELMEAGYVPAGPAAEAQRAGYDVGEVAGETRSRTEGARAYSRRRSELLVSAHQVMAEGGHFEAMPWDAELGVLLFVAPEHLPIVPGYALALADGVELSFPIDEERAEVITAAHAMDDVRMRLVFELRAAQDPTHAFCEAGAEGDMVISAVLLAAELVQRESGEPLARLETTEFVASAVRWGGEPDGAETTARPTAQVTSLALEGEGNGLGDDVEVVQLALESRLTECYLSGLAANARLQGAIVVGFEMDVEGRFHNPQLQIDAVGCSLVTSCAMRELARVQVPRTAPGGPLLIRATVTLRTEAEPADADR